MRHLRTVLGQQVGPQRTYILIPGTLECCLIWWQKELRILRWGDYHGLPRKAQNAVMCILVGSSACMHAQSLQSCPSFYNTMDCSPPCSSLHGISQAGILEWVAMLSSRGSSRPRDQTRSSWLTRGFFTPDHRESPYKKSREILHMVTQWRRRCEDRKESSEDTSHE